jgi:hypothetical protein
MTDSDPPLSPPSGAAYGNQTPTASDIVEDALEEGYTVAEILASYEANGMVIPDDVKTNALDMFKEK